MNTTPFQRQTENLDLQISQKELCQLRKICEYRQRKNFDLAFQAISQLRLSSLSEEDENLREELQYQESLCLYFSKNQPSKPLKNLHLIREKTKNQNMKIRCIVHEMLIRLSQCQEIRKGDIEILIQLLKRQPSKQKEVLLKLTGCSSIQRMQTITTSEIQSLTNSLKKKAIKFRVVSDWKFYIENNKEAIELKEKSLELSANQGEQNNSCKKELEEMKMLIQGKKVLSKYGNRIFNMRIICSQIKKISSNLLQKNISMKNIPKFCLPNILKILKEQQVILKESKLSSKIKYLINQIRKTEEIMEERIQYGEKIFAQLSKNNYKYCEFLENEKFLTIMKQTVAKKMSILTKLFKKRFRNFFDQISQFKNQ